MICIMMMLMIKVIMPNGIVISFNHIRKFSKEQGLDCSSVVKVMKGKIKHTKGWRAVPSDVQY